MEEANFDGRPSDRSKGGKVDGSVDRGGSGDRRVISDRGGSFLVLCSLLQSPFRNGVGGPWPTLNDNVRRICPTARLGIEVWTVGASETVIVTENGAEPLSDLPRDLIV